MESMVEKVARAIALEHLDPETRAAVDPEKWRVSDSYYDLARAAIEAMREPTPEMIAAGAWSNYGWTREQSIERGKEAVYDEYASNAASIYREIIDAALKEQEKVG